MVGFQRRETGWLGMRAGEVPPTRFRKGDRCFLLDRGWPVLDAGLVAVGLGLSLGDPRDVTASKGGWLGGAASRPRPTGTIRADWWVVEGEGSWCAWEAVGIDLARAPG